MKSDHIIAALITAGMVSIIGYVLFKENPAPTLPTVVRAPASAPSLDIVPPPRYQAPAPRAETYYTAPDQQRHANGLYKCIIAGRTIYQDEPCQEGRQAAVSGTMSVVPRHPVEPYKRLMPDSSGPRVAMIENDKPPPEHQLCPGLRQEIRNIDAQARRRSNEWLTAERRRVGKLMSELRCRAMD